MQAMLFVGLGGFLGSCFRYGITKWAAARNGLLPLGTLLANVVAGVCIGFIIGLEQHAVKLSAHTKLFLTTGLLGGLSTFSTFSLETVELFRAGQYMPACGNVALNLGLSIAGVVLGMLVAKLMTKNLFSV